MKSIYGKLISGFLLTILFSFVITGYISFQNSSGQLLMQSKEELVATSNYFVEIIDDYGYDEINGVLESYAHATNVNVFIMVDDNLEYYHTKTSEVSNEEVDNFFNEWDGSQIIVQSANAIIYGDVYQVDGHTIKIISTIDVSEEQNSYIMSTLVILGTVFLSGSFVFLVIADVIVKPITRITSAINELGKGNYNIHVNYVGDDEISKLNQGFNHMAKQLAKQEETRQKFISDISHEFQTPLTAIQGFANILKDEELPKSQREKYANIILFNSKRLSTLSKNMLQLTLLDSDELNLEKKKYSLVEQLDRVIEDQINSALIKNIEIQFIKPKKDILVDGDEDRLEQVWINVLSNAIKYTKKDGLITVTMKKVGKYVEVSFEDTGIGMSKEVISHIFERFYREEKARSIEGNGLGLSIVKSIIELHNGSIDVISEVDIGSTFIVKLPVEKK